VSLGETILVVEDDEDLLSHDVHVLQEMGYRVLEATTADEALAILDSTPSIDLLFTDVVLPGGKNGRQLADEAVRRRPGLRVLYTTGYSRNAIIHNGQLDAGVNLIGKPFTIRELAAKLRAVLDG
jgi:DNA-binding response OmpR family regulator